MHTFSVSRGEWGPRLRPPPVSSEAASFYSPAGERWGKRSQNRQFKWHPKCDHILRKCPDFSGNHTSSKKQKDLTLRGPSSEAHSAISAGVASSGPVKQ